MSNDKEWRQFEQLVARIEKTLAPVGAIVKSPDRIQDILTGSLREVDASVKIKVGSVPILITVECRKRSTTQDDTWIEQLATKKEKIGGAKTLAVSASGFSEPAKVTARLKGIELRTIDQVDDDDIINLIKSVVLVHKIMRIKVKNISAEIDSETPFVYKLRPDGSSGSVRALIRVEDNRFVSPYNILNLLMQEHSSAMLNVRPDRDKELRILSAQLPKKSLQVQKSDGNEFITSITYELECWCETKNEHLADGNHYKYMDNEKMLVQGVEFKTEIEGVPIIVSLALTNSIN